jgi:deoxyxylulose-5-phosphate synthase
MKILQTIFFLLLSVTGLCQNGTDVKYLLNGQEVDPKMLDFIWVKNIDQMVMVKTTNPHEVRITTKKEIEYLNYNELKAKAKVKQSENPPVIVDFKKIENEETMMIDKDLIKRIMINNGTIEIRTPWYKKRKKEQGKPRIVIR